MLTFGTSTPPYSASEAKRANFSNMSDQILVYLIFEYSEKYLLRKWAQHFHTTATLTHRLCPLRGFQCSQ